MQIVLLSGGSGKRLWPLSNNARSKQFLPLLEIPPEERTCDGSDPSMESMVQRVIRQVLEAGLTDEITIATNTSQKDIITNQLGDKVSIVTEPKRRDTFPAIALAASYLKFAKACPDDEVVVIMPCDPYTEKGYFQTIGKMAECVLKDVASLILMGITPTYPSAKYGYVVPVSSEASDESFQMVQRFTEKPTVKEAEELLLQHAYWNAGVFAFRLGYMMDIVRKYIQAGSFEEIRGRYTELPKISFDYEIAENEQSVAVVPFSGEWKDLGTWNTLTDELRQRAIGNSVIGPRCENTHVINELQHPIFVDGVKDVIVAACPDGILVCAKKETENIKKYVENLTPRPMYEERRWGTYRVLDDTTFEGGGHALTKFITMMPGKHNSYQLHHFRSETMTFIEGEGIFVLEGKVQKVRAGETVTIPKNSKHSIKAITRLSFIEVQNGHPLIEEDIERGEWDFENNAEIKK